jgi:hypothetical protein
MWLTTRFILFLARLGHDKLADIKLICYFSQPIFKSLPNEKTPAYSSI